jgi:hypothetical protein
MYILIAGVKEWSQDVNSALKSGLFLHLFGQSLYNEESSYGKTLVAQQFFPEIAIRYI